MGGEGPGEGWTYRAHLDGLRAVAVYLVVAFHAGVARLSGGFVGVDVFFVLSGYLVTSILLRDLAADGRVTFRRFYARRVRRLLPAAAVNLVVTAVVFSAVAAPADLAAAKESIRAASLYVSNWWFIAESADYFGTDITASPVAHYWSLSIEEQFYLAWPLLLGVLYRLAGHAGRHRMRVARAVVAGAGLASLVAALVLSDTDLNRAYYGTDTRAYQLLAGALLALTPGVVARARRLPGAARTLPLGAAALLVVLAASATSRFERGPVARGVVATGLTVALVVCLEGAEGGLGRWLLSRPPIVFLGRISYGTYLWHWIVIVVIERELEISHLSTLAVTATVATGLAALSYELLERPIRVAPVLDRFRVPVIGVGLVASLVVGVAIAPGVIDRGDGRASAALTAGADGAPVGVGAGATGDWGAAFADRFSYERCPPSEDTACRLTSGAGDTVLVVGESHAAMYLPMLERLAERHDWNLYGGLLDYCPWTHGVRYAMAGPHCLADQDRLFDRILPALDPDIVILSHRPIDDPANSMPMSDHDGALTPAERKAALARSVRSVVAELRRDGRTVVLLEQVPAPPRGTNPLSCLSEAEVPEACRFVATTGPNDEERVYRDLDAGDDGVVSVDLDRGICPYFPICDPIVGGHVVRWDETHLTQSFAATLLDGLDRVLADQGVVS